MIEFKKVYTLDTNIILSDANNLKIISQNGSNKIVLPETVLDEVDSKKSGLEEISYQAREFGRILSNAIVIDSKKENGSTIVSLKVDNMFIDIVSLDSYNIDNTDKSIVNDRKIVAVAKFVEENYKEESVFLTLDTLCKIRAISNNVLTEDLSYKKKDEKLNPIKEIEVKSLDLMGKNILDIDPEYTKDKYCYKFVCKEKESLGVIKNNVIHILNQRELMKSDIKPRNIGQFFALQGMTDPFYNVVLIEALAGSGKTLLAVAAGMKNVDMRRYDKIVYIRNSVESTDKGEDVGYLSGNKEKFEIYNFPLFDTLDFIVRNKKRTSSKSKAKTTVTPEKDIENLIELLVKKYKIETFWIGGARGRTLSNAYVIVDEIQNFSKKSLQTMLTRIDESCKIVGIGSNAQIDNMFINKYTNGLATLIEAAYEQNPEINMFVTKLDTVERGRITAWAERIFAKGR